jgi:hypothetical protein
MAGAVEGATDPHEALRREQSVNRTQPTTGSNGLTPGTKMTLTLRWWGL